jgi:hypothetical protein
MQSPNPRRVASKYLKAAAPTVRLDPRTKSQATAALIRAGMDGNGRFPTLGKALSVAADVLATFGIEWGEVINSHSLNRPQGSLNIDLAKTNQEDSFSPMGIANSVLAFQWYTLDNGQFEVVAYLS